MAGEMSIRVSAEQSRVPVTVFHITGEVNVDTADRLQAQAREAYDSGTRNLVLDLSRVPYISTAGLRAIHATYTLLRSHGPDESRDTVSKGLRNGSYKSLHLKLLDPIPPVREILKIAGFDMYLETYQDLQDAVASF